MALAATTHFSIRADATASNVNGGGFNPGNANFLTDLTTDSNTANTAAPVVSSASYNFAARDVGHWVFIKSGTNWIPGWYQIASVASNKATLNGAVGAATLITRYLNTVVGVATVGTPTGGTFGIDYSLGTTTILTRTDATAAGTTNFASATGGFERIFNGNLLHITASTGLTVGWYEQVAFVDGNNITLDANPGTGSATTFFIAGSMSMNSTLDDDFFNAIVAGGTVWARGSTGTIGFGETVQPANAGSGVNVCRLIGYATVRGDYPTDSTRPLFSIGAFTYNPLAGWHTHNIIITGTAQDVIDNPQAGRGFYHCKVVNTSTTSGRSPIDTQTDFLYGCELISYLGPALQVDAASDTVLVGCWLHSSIRGVLVTGSGVTLPLLINCIISDTFTASIEFANNTAQVTEALMNCTLFGRLDTFGIGVLIGASRGGIVLRNCIISGFATGVSHGTATPNGGRDDYNNYHNNDADVSNWIKGPNDISVDPAFADVGQVTGTTGKFDAGGSKLIDTSKNFTALGVVAGDHVYIASGSGVTTPMFHGINSISTTTNPNDTLNLDVTPGTNTTADKVYHIETGHNFLPENSLVLSGGYQQPWG